MIILFLDFDGVTHHLYSLSRRDEDQNAFFVYLPRVETVLRDYPEVRVVISSEWRNHHPLDELRSFFAEDLRSRIIGTTVLEPRAGRIVHGRRHELVEQFLTRHGLQGTPWLALDDDREHYRADAPLVKCEDGFFDSEETALRSTLERIRASLIDSPAYLQR